MTQIQLTDYILYLCLDGRMVEVKTKLPITLYNRQNDEFLLIPQVRQYDRRTSKF